MRPILLAGHERSLTKVLYNKPHGDLIFSTSKDNKPNVWYSHNGERLGSFHGHNGTVWDIDVSYDSKTMITASADSTMRLWNVYTGEQLHFWEFKSAVRSVCFNQGNTAVCCVTDATMGNKSMIHIIDLASKQTTMTIKVETSKAMISKWGSLNRLLYVGHDDGTISQYSPVTGEQVKFMRKHTACIQDIQFSPSGDFAYFITASKDHTSMVWDAADLKVLKTFKTDRPVNSASISPIRSHIMLGGGQEAMSVTTTGAKAGKFEVRFFHQVFQDEIGRVKGHFGPINTLAFHPDGKSFASGGEDGYIRLHHFDDDYFKFKYDEETIEGF